MVERRKIIVVILVFATLLSCFAAVMLLSGCAAEAQQYEVALDNGDNISMSFTPSDGYEMASELSIPFEITKDGGSMVQGSFVDISTFDAFVAIIGEGDEYIELLDKGDDYLFYKVSVPDEDIVEYDYILALTGSNTAILIGSTVNKETMEDVVGLLDFSVIE